jgi:hypothetical protein
MLQRSILIARSLPRDVTPDLFVALHQSAPSSALIHPKASKSVFGAREAELRAKGGFLQAKSSEKEKRAIVHAEKQLEPSDESSSEEAHEDPVASLLSRIAESLNSPSARSQIEALLAEPSLVDQLQSSFSLSRHLRLDMGGDVLVKKQVAGRVVEIMSVEDPSPTDSDLVIQALSFMGLEFYSSDWTARELKKAEEGARAFLIHSSDDQENAIMTEERMDLAFSATERLARVMGAAARFGHMIRQSHLLRLSSLLLAGLKTLCLHNLVSQPSYGSPVSATTRHRAMRAAIEGLWCLGKYRVRLLEEHGSLGSTAAESALLLLEQAFSRNNALQLSHAAKLAEALVDLDVPPGSRWLDAWLSSLVALFPEPASSTSRPFTYITSSLASLFSSISRLSYDPGDEWITMAASSLGRSLLHGPSSSPAQLDLISSLSLVAALESLSIIIGGRSTDADPAHPGAKRSCRRSIALLCGAALRSILAKGSFKPSALLIGPCSLSSRLLAALARLLPPLTKGPWLRSHIDDMEGLVMAASVHLKEASPSDLVALTSSLASLGFYPGIKFLKWHDAACTRLVVSPLSQPRKGRPVDDRGADERKGMTDAQLVEVREAYIALGHKTERRLYERMEAARARFLVTRARQKEAGSNID